MKNMTIEKRKLLEEPVVIPRIGLSVIGGTQPDKIKEITTGCNDGLSARFLYVWPASIPPKRPTEKPDNLLLTRLFKRVLDLPVGSMPHTIRFSDEAAALFEGYRQWLYAQEHQANGQFLAFLGKQAGTVARLALVLEVLKWATSSQQYPVNVIAPDTVQDAIRVSKQYLIPMGQRVFEDGSKPLEARHSEAMARWIMTHKPTLLNARDVYKKAKIEGVRDAKTAKAAIAEMVSANWLIEASQREGETTGRKRSDYLVNPRLWQAVEALEVTP
jgi:hypothetical protein